MLLPGLVFLACVSQPAGGESLERELVSLLNARQMRARVGESLKGKYGSPDDRGFWKVSVDENEEYDTVLGGALFLLKGDRWTKLVAACRRCRATPPQTWSPVGRVLLQQRLWAAFDQLYLNGINPAKQLSFDRNRWHSLLYELAQTLKYVALPAAEIARLPESTPARRQLLSDIPLDRVVEIYSFEDLAIHDQAQRCRVVSRVYIYDPGVDLRAAPLERIEQLLRGRWQMSPGGVAVLQRNALTVSNHGVIYATFISPVLSSYRIQHASTPKLGQYFSLYRLKPDAKQCGFDDYTPFSGSTAEAWALLDLPNIPRVVGLGERVPIWESCRNCHSGVTLGLQPRITHRRADMFQVVSPGDAREDDYLSARIINIKRLSAEFRALHAYMDMDDATAEKLARSSSMMGGG